MLLAVGAFSFVGMPVAQAADGTESLRNNDFVGANDYYWYYDEKEKNKDKKWKTYQYKATDIFNNRSRHDLPNYQGGGAKLPGAITAGLYAQAGQQTVTIGDRNAGQSKGSVFIGEHSGYNNGDNAPDGMKNNYVTSVGFQSDATGWGSIAIGSNAKAENSKMESQVVEEVGDAHTSGTVSDDTYGIKENPTIQGASVALGYNAHSKDGNIAIGANSEATSTEKGDSYVSVGNGTLKRRITNVAKGTDNSDVVTVGQMNDAIKQADNLNVNAGWGINVADENDPTNTGKGTKNVISLKHNLGTGYNDDEANGMIIGGLVEDRDPAKQYGAADANSVIVGAGKALASGKSSVVVGGLDNVASGATSVVVGGDNNNAAGNQSAVFGGRDNTAAGIASTAGGGIMNVANGQQAVALGGAYNYALGTSSTAIGGTGGNGMYGYSTSVNGNYSVSLAGGSTGTDALNGLAAGNQSVVTTANGTAVGYQATTDQEGTIAFGHDAGDVSGYAVTWKQRTDGKTNADHTTNDYTQVPASVTPTTYTDAYYNRLVKVADGQDDHDVVVMEQLKQYAEKNASNIGNNLTVPPVYQTDDHGNIKLGSDNKPLIDKEKTEQKRKDDQTTNKNDWGQALGADPFTAGTATTATDASTSDQLVTGKTLYNYDAPVAASDKKLNYVSANNTTGQNLSALDAQVADNASKLNDKTHNIKYYSVNDKKSSTQETLPTVKGLLADNSDNKGAKGMGSLASGFSTEADGIASTVAGSYSGVINQNGNSGLDFRGAAALSYGTFNVNQNTADTAATKTYSGVANSIVGQANMTTDSNAAIIYGAGNTVTNSYRPIDLKKAGAILDNVSNPTNLGKAMQDAVKDSGGQVMVMGGGNTVDKAYMTQVTGVGNTVTGADSTYAEGTSTQYNFVDGFQNELTNGKHDYIIGSNNKVSGESIDKNQSNIVFGDNHKLTNRKNNVIIGSSDNADDETTASDVVAIGHNAKASAEGGVAIGSGSEATVEGNKVAGYDPATGTNSTNTTSATWQATNGAVSVGKADGTVTRQINGVAAGTNETDAVNVAQLKTAQTGLINKGLTFAANTGEYTAKLGSKVTIQGSAKKADHTYTSDNLTTEVDDQGNIKILMDENMSADKIIVGKDGKQGHIGLTGADGTNGKDGTSAVDITVKKGYDDTAKGINGTNGVDGQNGISRIVYEDGTGEHQVATLEDGMKYAGDDGQTDATKVIAKKLNNTVDIIGGAKGALTEENIGVNNVNGKLKVQLAKDLKDLNSTSYTTTTGEGEQATTSTTVVVNGNGLTVTGGPSVTKDGINGGGKAVTNVGSGADADGNYTDATKNNAANIGDVQKIAGNATTELTNKGLTFAANTGEYTAKLGSKVTIQGSAKKADHTYTSDNLTTEVDDQGNIKILMDENMSADKIIVGKDGKQGHIGLTGADGTNGKDGTSAVDITVKKGYDDTAKGINGTNGVDGKDGISRIVYEDGTGEHQIATMEDGLKFKGDDETVISKKLNNTLEIIGGAKDNLTKGNIGVVSENGKLNVRLAKDLTGLNSTTYTTTTGEGESATTSTTVVNGNGLTIKNGPSITNNGIDGGSEVITNVGSGIEKGSDGKYTVTKDNTSNAANIGDVDNMVNQAVKGLSDATDTKLADKANVNASNIGANISSDTDKQKANEEAWGDALGKGEIKAGEKRLVTGDTVAKAIGDEKTAREAADQAINEKIGTLDKDGNYIKKDDSISKNLSTLDGQVKNNADAISKISRDVSNLSDNAVQYDKDTNKSKVTLAGEDGTTIDNVKDGTLTENGKEAVNGGQLWKVDQKVENNTTEINKIKNGDFTDASKTAIHNIAKDAVEVVAGTNTTVTKTEGTDTTSTKYTVNVEGKGKVTSGDTGLISGDTLYKEVHVDKDGSYIKSGNTVGQNLSRLDTGLKTTSDLIHTNGKGDTIQIGGNSTAMKIDVNGKDGKGRVITGVVTDASDPNSAANVGYVNGLTAANTQQVYRDMNRAYGSLNNNINRAAAGSNALAALHPLDFDPADKASFAVGYGHYRNANAAAVGAFYQPNANTMVNMGISLGNGDPGFNAGVSFKIGKGSAYNGVSKAEMAQTIHDQATEISAIKANDAAKDKRIDALEKENQEMKKQIQEILARLNG